MTRLEDTPEFKRLEALASAVKKDALRRQTPRSHIKTLEIGAEVKIAGATFIIAKQERRKLHLQGDKENTFLAGYDLDRIAGWILANKDEIEIEGWGWRPVRYKKGRLTLRPIAPIDKQLAEQLAAATKVNGAAL